ncbi:MAG: hexose kinase [Bacteroidales bacterium]|nr:hexose kinase [Bacteroidales bacterium]MBN2819560.1 hexose kinase [Bacteroidales bacterium]
MILTVTLNPAIDKILILDEFVLHKLHRLEKGEMSLVVPGGKGVNIAHNLKKLGNTVATTGFAGGHSGHLLCERLRIEGISTSFVFTNGVTRTNTSILDRKNETLTEINDFGQEISAEDVSFFIETYDRLLHRIRIVVIAGSLPKGVDPTILTELIQLASKKGKQVIVHTLSDYTEECMKASPYLIVPDMRSRHELFGKKIDGIAQFLEAGRHILMHSPHTQVVCFIHRIENVVAVTRDKSYILRPKDLKIVNMLGYGDAYVAGFIHAQDKGLPLKTILRYASAAGLTDVEDLYKEIRDIHLIDKNIKRIDLEEVE